MGGWSDSGVEDVLVLCYHALSRVSRLETTVHPDRFERQVAALRDMGYVGTTFTEALTAPARSRVVAITFDDGSKSVRRDAWPILEAAGFTATAFVPTAWVGRPDAVRWAGLESARDTADRDELVCMSWEDLAALADGGWEIASHTRTHPYLTMLDDRRLADELAGSRADCEQRLGRGCRALAYPYSDVDARVVAAASAAGYTFAATVAYLPEWPRPLCWPRLGVAASDSDRRFARRTSPTVRRVGATLLAGRTTSAARRLKRRVAGRRGATGPGRVRDRLA
jgi:peptidoglycan/xylan/chitin deacetylase (PgdA/CDA1 family)